MEEIQELIESGDIDGLRALLREDESIAQDEEVLQAAVMSGNVGIVMVLQAFGADATYAADEGFRASSDVFYGQGDQLPMLRYLIEQGADFSYDWGGEEEYNPQTVAYERGQFRLLVELTRSGFPPNWNGEQLEAILLDNPTPLDLAVLDSNLELADEFADAGLEPHPLLLREVALNGDLEAVKWLLDRGVDIEASDGVTGTALGSAVVGNHEAVAKLLLDRRADPDNDNRLVVILQAAPTKQMMKLLLENGAHPAKLTYRLIRMYLGWEPTFNALTDWESVEWPATATPPDKALTNPTRDIDPFRLFMIRYGLSINDVREEYYSDDDSETWTANRDQQSLTELPDGRVVLIGGENEEHFLKSVVYNDVIVVHPDGEFELYDYPPSIFPCTTPASATVIKDSIYVIAVAMLGSLEPTELSVFRLNLDDYSIDPILTTGDNPGVLFYHRASLIEPNLIKVYDGRYSIGGETVQNDEIFLFDTATNTWTKL